MTLPKKSICDYRRRLGTRLLTAVALLAVTGAVFHVHQNVPGSAGGSIAPVKTLWLLVVIVFWFLLPLAWSLDRTLARRARQACGLLLVNMLARGAIELWMMYVSNNWRHAYGIGHDIGSAALCFGLAVFVGRETRWLAAFFVYCAALFMLESYFAVYLRNLTHSDGTVFFVPAAQQHRTVLQVTWGAVAASAVALVYLFWKWSYAAASRSSAHD